MRQTFLNDQMLQKYESIVGVRLVSRGKETEAACRKRFLKYTHFSRKINNSQGKILTCFFVDPNS